MRPDRSRSANVGENPGRRWPVTVRTPVPTGERGRGTSWADRFPWPADRTHEGRPDPGAPAVRNFEHGRGRRRQMTTCTGADGPCSGDRTVRSWPATVSSPRAWAPGGPGWPALRCQHGDARSCCGPPAQDASDWGNWPHGKPHRERGPWPEGGVAPCSVARQQTSSRARGRAPEPSRVTETSGLRQVASRRIRGLSVGVCDCVHGR